MKGLNQLKAHPERITKADIKMVNDLDYAIIEFQVSKKIIVRLNRKIIFALMCFLMEMIWFILLIYQIKNLKIV